MVTSCLFLQYDPSLEIFNMRFQHTLNVFDMVFNTVFNMVHTIGEFLCLKCIENILKKHFVKFQNVLKSVMHVEN